MAKRLLQYATYYSVMGVDEGCKCIIDLVAINAIFCASPRVNLESSLKAVERLRSNGQDMSGLGIFRPKRLVIADGHVTCSEISNG